MPSCKGSLIGAVLFCSLAVAVLYAGPDSAQKDDLRRGIGSVAKRQKRQKIYMGAQNSPPYAMKKKDKQKTGYVPKEYSAVDNIDRDKYSEEEIERAREEVASQNKRVKGLSILSVIWTFLSTVYAIVSSCILISRRWVEHTVTYVLIGILVLYVGIFIGVAIAAFASPKDGKKNMKGVKTALKFLKPIMSIVLVALSITEVIAVSEGAFSLAKVAFMVLTMLVAFLQIAFRVLLLVAKARAKKIAKGYEVRVERYIDGIKKKKGFRAKLKEKQYRSDH